ncbi:MAG: hypothetical protein ACRELF_29720 [Gemmataceae bacterium]
MNERRRQFLMAAVWPFVSAFAGAAEDRRKRLGVVQYSYALRLAAERSAGKIGFADTLTFVEHCHELGAGGVQVGLGTRDNEYLTKLRKKLEAYGIYLEGEIRLPKDRGDGERFTTEVRCAREAGVKVPRTVLLGGRRYEKFGNAGDFRRVGLRCRGNIGARFAVVRKIAGDHC